MATILVVDDEQENVDILQHMLRGLGHDVLCASDGAEALSLAEARRPAAILLDVLLPHVDGIEVCRRLQQNSATRSIPVLLVSGLAQEEHIVSGLDAGAVDYITKPFNDTVLAARLRSALRAKEAYDAVEASARLRSDFLATTSDEMQTPLASIIQSTDNLLALDRSEEDRRAAINSIRRTGDRLLRIVQDIRDLSELEAGRVEADMSECSPLEVVADVTALMQRQSRARGVQLHVEFAGPVPQRVRSNPARLRQILFYLLGNAVRLTAGQRVALRTCFLPTSALGSVLQFEVTDDGAGLCGHEMGGRLESETEIDPSAARDLGAAGFALAMCSHHTAVLGGRMYVTHGPAASTRVRVMVPTGSLDGVRLLDHPLAGTASAGPVMESEGHGLEGCRILFAEDDLAMQKRVSRWLTDVGGSVTVAADGPSAVALALAANASGNPFDVMVLEGHLTVMNGQSAGYLIRQRGYRGRVIVLADADDPGHGAHDGCDILIKPIDQTGLVAAVRPPGAAPMERVPVAPPTGG